MKKTLLILTTVIGSMTFAQDCSELFISEYVEGWNNNKALEIYNPTNAPIDLSAYMVIRYSNGSTTATAANAIQLSGMVGARDVFVATLDKQDPNGTGFEAPIWDSLQIRTDGYFCPVYNTNNAFYWNGDDAIVLAIGTPSNIAGAVAVDIFGKIGEDPGTAWTSMTPFNGPGVEVTKDHSMIRKSTILIGETNPVIALFDPLADWDSIPAVIDISGTLYGNWNTIGWHDCDCNTLGSEELVKANISIFPNPSNGDFYVKGAADFTSIVILNSLGQTIKTVSNNVSNVVKFSMGEQKGVYFVKLTDSNDNVTTKRVIIK
ncbi:MAG: T9SS type A sorting domain-containing protein [Fluviicola sp.]|nr:T9SS type A sorting domain-containing protein [Fluviicola sp.]